MNSRICGIIRFNILRSCKNGQLFDQIHQNKASPFIIRSHEILQLSKYTTETPKQPVTKKLDTPEFHKIFTPGMKNLINIFEKNNYELRIVGDPVCDLLLQKQPASVDFASTATPEQMKAMLTKEKINVLKNKGETHGNISVQIDNQTFKVSTLRTDAQTSNVTFTTDWYLDARRRDLSIGAMFLGCDGTVYDYFNGLEDVEKRTVSFVGKPARRIKEDYFRIMRYFRYYSSIAKDVNSLDNETLEAIKKHAKGLNDISSNKMWSELSKILSSNLKFDILRKMLNLGLAPALRLPKDLNMSELDALEKRAGGLALLPITIITSLFKNEQDMTIFNEKINLPKYDRAVGFFVIKHRDDKLGEDPLQPYKETLILSTENQNSMRGWIEQLISYRGDEKTLTEFKNWEVPVFPIKPQQLIDRGLKKGSKLQVVMTIMKTRWLRSAFATTEQELMMSFDEIVRKVEEKPTKSKKKGK